MVVAAGAAAVHNAFPCFAAAPNGDYVAGYRNSTTHHLSINGDIELRRSTDQGATWGDPTTLLDDDTWDYRDVDLITTSAGTMVLVNARGHKDGSYPPDSAQAHRSTDNGVTWGSPITISGGFVAQAGAAGGMFQLANGELLSTIYGRDVVGADTYTKCIVSTDDGASWSVRSTIAKDLGSVAYNEGGIAQLPNGTVVAVIRNRIVNTNRWDRTLSTDNGATWGPLAPIFGGAPISGWPYLTIHDGQIFAVARDLGSDKRARIVSSSDGTDWVYGPLLDADGDGGQMTYGQARSIGGELTALYGYETPVNGTNSTVYFVPPA